MPLTVSTIAGGSPYASPFIGPVQHTVAIDVNIANLTTFEVDAHGRVKPGVLLTRGGSLIGAEAISTHGAAVATGGNVGNPTIGSIVSGYGDDAPTETITVTMLTATTFSVAGTRSGNMGTGSTGVVFASPQINFLMTVGGTPAVAGDSFTIASTSGTSDQVFGVTVEAIKVTTDNVAGLTGIFSLAVCTAGLLNRDIVEDNLGRVLTAAEVAACAANGAIKLT